MGDDRKLIDDRSLTEAEREYGRQLAKELAGRSPVLREVIFWVPVSERLPEESLIVFTWNGQWPQLAARLGARFFTPGGATIGNVTHWAAMLKGPR